LQRSSETIDEFETIYTTHGQGNSTQITHYSYTDYSVNSNVIYYYRLKQLDYDGKETYSEVVEAEIKDDDVMVSVNPNPFTKNLRINYKTDRVSNVSIELFNPIGAKIISVEVADQEPGYYDFTLDASQFNLNSGIYILHLRINDNLYTRRVIRSE
jgi:hypothetical protein